MLNRSETLAAKHSLLSLHVVCVLKVVTLILKYYWKEAEKNDGGKKFTNSSHKYFNNHRGSAMSICLWEDHLRGRRC